MQMCSLQSRHHNARFEKTNAGMANYTLQMATKGVLCADGGYETERTGRFGVPTKAAEPLIPF